MFDAYVSLGDNCEAGLHFRRINYEESSIFRFSYIRSFPHLITIINSDFKDIFLKENLTQAYNKSLLLDTKYGIAFHSEITTHLDPNGNITDISQKRFNIIYEQERNKIIYLVEKWRKLVNSRKRVLYFYKQNTSSSRKDAETLLHIFKKRYPLHNFLILYIQPEQSYEPAWGLDKLHNIYIKKLAPYERAHEGHDKGWDQIFKNYPLNLKAKSLALYKKYSKLINSLRKSTSANEFLFHIEEAKVKKSNSLTTNHVSVEFSSGFWQDSQDWAWGSSTAQLRLRSKIGGELSFKIIIPHPNIHPISFPITIRISFEKKEISQIVIRRFGEYIFQRKIAKFQIIKIKINSNKFVIPNTLLNNGDLRKISYIIKDFRITPTQHEGRQVK